MFLEHILQLEFILVLHFDVILPDNLIWVESYFIFFDKRGMDVARRMEMVRRRSMSSIREKADGIVLLKDKTIWRLSVSPPPSGWGWDIKKYEYRFRLHWMERSFVVFDTCVRVGLCVVDIMVCGYLFDFYVNYFALIILITLITLIVLIDIVILCYVIDIVLVLKQE